MARRDLPPGVTVVESAGGANAAFYREVAGEWFDSVAKSEAPGLSHFTFRARACNLSGVPADRPATARFRIPPAARGEQVVYVTWGYSANVARATYVIRHRAGWTTRTLTQNGWGVPEDLPFLGNGNLWVPLGRFLLDGESYVEVSASEESGALDTVHNQRVYADAMLLTKEPLSLGWTAEPAGGMEAVEMTPSLSSIRRMDAGGEEEAILIETDPAGSRFSQYREISGDWRSGPLGNHMKSIASGLTTIHKCGTRYATGGATARFTPQVPRGGYRLVSVTWPLHASVDSVVYRIVHRDGTTEQRLKQGDPSYGAAGDFNRWIVLGEFFFAPGTDHYVELVVPPDAKPIAGATPRAFADAVLFSPSRVR